MTNAAKVPDAARALAEADFSWIANRFTQTGWQVVMPARGIVQITTNPPRAVTKRIVISVGVHGDETGPIEMLAQLLSDLAATPSTLGADLMVVVGNLDAIAQGKRFIDADFNRLFVTDRGDLQTAAEAARATVIMQATRDFLGNSGGEKWHLDLHTAIRPSLYSTFAVVPELIAAPDKARLLDWLAAAAIGAVIMNPKSAGTYSYYTAETCGAASSTVELGRIGALGQNDLTVLARAQAALKNLLDGTALANVRADAKPHVFKVAQEIIKRSADFQMTFDRATPNFTALAPGAVIAHDGDMVYRVGTTKERVVFPNPDVKIGQRAGLMVVRQLGADAS